jgi:hypothetical protein
VVRDRIDMDRYPPSRWFVTASIWIGIHLQGGS